MFAQEFFHARGARKGQNKVSQSDILTSHIHHFGLHLSCHSPHSLCNVMHSAALVGKLACLVLLSLFLFHKESVIGLFTLDPPHNFIFDKCTFSPFGENIKVHHLFSKAVEEILVVTNNHTSFVSVLSQTVQVRKSILVAIVCRLIQK